MDDDPRSTQELLEAFYLLGDRDAKRLFVARIQAEMEPSLSRLMSPHYRSLYLNDAMQHAWLKALELIRNRRRENKPVPILSTNWFLTVALNYCKDQRRNERKTSTLRKLETEKLELRAADHVRHREAIEQVERVLDRLPDSDSELVRKVDLEGNTVYEAGRMLGICSDAAAYARYERAHKKLQSVVEDPLFISRFGPVD